MCCHNAAIRLATAFRMRFTAASMLDRQDMSNDYLSFKATNWLLGPSDRSIRFALFDTT